jgi:WD40 repeat protein
VTATPALVPHPTENPILPAPTILDIAESGDWMAVTSAMNLNLYRDGAPVHLLDTFQNPPLDFFGSLAFSPDAKYLAALVTERPPEGKTGTRLRVYDVKTGFIVRNTLAYEGSFNEDILGVALAYSPDGKLLASSAGDGWTSLMDTTTGNVLGKLNTLATGTFAMIFSADGKRLTMINRLGRDVSTGYDGAQVQVWDVSNPTLAHQIMNRGASLDWPLAHWAALSADGHYVAFSNRQHELEIWNLQDGKLVGKLVMNTSLTWIEDIALSPTGDKLAFVQRQKIVSGVPNHRTEEVTVRALRLHLLDGSLSSYDEISQPPTVGANGAYLLRFDPDNGLDYVVGDGNYLLRWDFSTGQTEVLGF